MKSHFMDSIKEWNTYGYGNYITKFWLQIITPSSQYNMPWDQETISQNQENVTIHCITVWNEYNE